MLMYRCFGNVNGIHYLAHTISRIFSEHRFNKVRIRQFQLEIASSKFFKLIADGPNSCSTTPVKGANPFVTNKTYFERVLRQLKPMP